jgi:hypothetical protein
MQINMTESKLINKLPIPLQNKIFYYGTHPVAELFHAEWNKIQSYYNNQLIYRVRCNVEYRKIYGQDRDPIDELYIFIIVRNILKVQRATNRECYKKYPP